MDVRNIPPKHLDWPAGTRIRRDGVPEDASLAAPGDGGVSHVLLIHDGDADATCARIREERGRGALVALVHEGHDLDLLTAAMRAGAVDAVSTTASDDEWAALRDRCAERLQARRERETLARERSETNARLRRRHDELQLRLAETDRDLDHAHDELTRHTRQLSLLYRFGRELSTARNWDDTLARLLENLSGFVEAEGAALVLRPAPDAPFAPRQSWCWRDGTWDHVLLHLEQAHSERIGERAADFFGLSDGEHGGKVLALPLEHTDVGFGYLLLLGLDEDETPDEIQAFLRAVQLILAEEVAGAQMLDRMRELSIFNARVLETVQSGIWVVDEHARTIYSNRVAKEMLTGRFHEVTPVIEPRPGVGRGRDAGARGAGAEFFRREAFDTGEPHELFLDGVLKLHGTGALPFVSLTESPGGRFQGEGLVQRQDASIPVLVTSSLMQGRADDERWLVVVLEDLCESKKLDAERRRADSLQSTVEMSATLAHEIRNPLMGLSAQAELLADHLDEDDPRRRYIDVITDEVDRINDTITRMLQYVRPCEPRRGDCDLGRLVRDCIDLAAPRAQARDVVVSTDLEATAWSCDGALLKQVVLNLLLNAVDASPEGGVVTVAARRRRSLEIADAATGLRRRTSGLQLRIADRGAGFGDLDPDHVFRPFFTTKSNGTGLGLPISRKIVEAHGGNIRAERLGRETVFSVLLPEADEDTARHSEVRA